METIRDLRRTPVVLTPFGRGCHAVDSPPSKAVPPDCPRQNNRSPPAADCGLFAIAFATALAYGEQPGLCLLDQNKVR